MSVFGYLSFDFDYLLIMDVICNHEYFLRNVWVHGSDVTG